MLLFAVVNQGEEKLPDCGGATAVL